MFQIILYFGIERGGNFSPRKTLICFGGIFLKDGGYLLFWYKTLSFFYKNENITHDDDRNVAKRTLT